MHSVIPHYPYTLLSWACAATPVSALYLYSLLTLAYNCQLCYYLGQGGTGLIVSCLVPSTGLKARTKVFSKITGLFMLNGELLGEVSRQF